MARTDLIIEGLKTLFPHAHCELIHHNVYELLIAVTLSAQTTDARVNMVTKDLFTRYPDVYALAKASLKDVEKIIASVGLYHNKAKNIIALSQKIVKDYDGKIPSTRKELMTLDGVGRKSANVVLSVGFGLPAMAVDTHVARVAKRLGLAKYDDDVLKIEAKLCKKLPKESWSITHHRFIFFGRYLCKAKNPECKKCPFTAICKRAKYEDQRL